MAKAHQTTLLLIASFLVHFLLSFYINKGDVLVHIDWGKLTNQQGLVNSYFHSGYTYTPLTQPPLITLLFHLSYSLYDLRFKLASLHNRIDFPPGIFIYYYDQYAHFFLFRGWGIVGNFLLIYYLLRKFRPGLLGKIFIIFNPTLIFLTAVWGQNDVLSALLYFLAFVFLISHPSLSIFSLLSGLLIKPSSVFVLPFYLYLYLQQHYPITKMITHLFISGAFVLLLFLPFIKNYWQAPSEIATIITHRILPSSKGVVRASHSAFNLYSLVFRLDTTPVTTQIASIPLSVYGYIFLVLIIVGSIFHYRQHHYIPLTIFFIIQGTFLFYPGMLERYFILAFVSSLYLLNSSDFRPLHLPLIIQNILWLINLVYSFYYRDSSPIRLVFQSFDYLPIRLISLFSILLYFQILTTKIKANAGKNIQELL